MALPSSAQQVNKKIKGGNQLGSAIIRSIGEAAKIGIIWVQVIKLYNYPNFETFNSDWSRVQIFQWEQKRSIIFPIT